MQTGFNASRSIPLAHDADTVPQASAAPEVAARADAGLAPTDAVPRAATAALNPLLAARDEPGTRPSPAAVQPTLGERLVQVQASAGSSPQEPSPGPGPGSAPTATQATAAGSVAVTAPVSLPAAPALLAPSSAGTILRPVPRYPPQPLYSVRVGGDLLYPQARGIDGPGPVALRRRDDASTGLLAFDVNEHLVVMMVGATPAAGPGPIPLPGLTAMVMVDPEDDDYLEQADRALAVFRSQAGEPVTVRVGFDADSLSALIESQMGPTTPLSTFLSRFGISDRPPAGLSRQQMQVWVLNRLEDAHEDAAVGLAERLGGVAIELPFNAVFLDPTGEVDLFEDEPDIESASQTGNGPGFAAATSSSSSAALYAPRSPSPDGSLADDETVTDTVGSKSVPGTPGSTRSAEPDVEDLGPEPPAKRHSGPSEPPAK